MLWMNKEAEVHGSSEDAKWRKTVGEQVHVRCTQAERSDSIIPLHHTSLSMSQRNNFVPVPLRQDVSASAVENCSNKTKHSTTDVSPRFQFFLRKFEIFVLMYKWLSATFCELASFGNFLVKGGERKQCKFASP